MTRLHKLFHAVMGSPGCGSTRRVKEYVGQMGFIRLWGGRETQSLRAAHKEPLDGCVPQRGHVPCGRFSEQEAAPPHSPQLPFLEFPTSRHLFPSHPPSQPPLRSEASPGPGPPGDVEAGGSSDQGGRTGRGETKPVQQSQTGFWPGSPPAPSQGVGRQQGPR